MVGFLARRRGSLGSRRNEGADELIPEASDAAVQGVEGGVTEEAAPPASTEAATDTSAQNTATPAGEVAT